MSVDTEPHLSAIPFEEFLISRGLLTAAAIDRAKRLQRESSERLGAILVKLGMVSEQDLATAFSVYTKTPLISANEFPSIPILGDRLSKKFLKRFNVLPITDGPEGMVLAVADPLDHETIEAIRYAAEAAIRCRIALPSDISKAFERLYGDGPSKSERIVARFDGGRAEIHKDDSERLNDLASEAPIIRLVNLWIDNAVEARASDIHIEPTENAIRVRYRIDGSLHDVEEVPPQFGTAISSRIKIMARLDIAERRLPQDGKFRLAIRGRDIDFRVSIIPIVHGEALVLRILDRSRITLDFATLGYDDIVLNRYLSVLHRPHGILLVTGPTGSGKTTTLYTSLIERRTSEIKILTVEDPIEYQLDGINQTQIHPQIGLTFANALRSFLRHDPDVILVGEIRDGETARIAVQAALTGHLVLSTLHTNDAASSITRLLDMGVDDYLIASTVNGIAAQRLVRRLCLHCRAPYRMTAELATKLRFTLSQEGPASLFRPGGCSRCDGSGFSGRTSIVEVLVMTDVIRELIMKHAPSEKIQRAAESEGMETIYRNGVRKCLAGLTTLDEVLRVTANQ